MTAQPARRRLVVHRGGMLADFDGLHHHNIHIQKSHLFHLITFIVKKFPEQILEAELL